MFCCAVLCVVSSFTIILMAKRVMVALLYLSSWCIVTVILLWLFLTVTWVGLQSVIVIFPDHVYLFYLRGYTAFVSFPGALQYVYLFVLVKLQLFKTDVVLTLMIGILCVCVFFLFYLILCVSVNNFWSCRDAQLI